MYPSPFRVKGEVPAVCRLQDWRKSAPAGSPDAVLTRLWESRPTTRPTNGTLGIGVPGGPPPVSAKIPDSGSCEGRCDPERFQRALLEWFDGNRRDLPWRRTLDPYAIWVSEVMLQQTRVEVAIPRYGRFLSRFPSMESLAAATATEVAAEWSGLGYYRRAANLHAAAQMIVRDHDGLFPMDPKRAVSLPGVGAYTVHAVLSIAYGLPLAVVDGNVERVLSRLSLLPVRPRRVIQKEADRLLSASRPGDANQALMELGATVCLPRSPRCGECPLPTVCGAIRKGRVALYPPPSPRRQEDQIDTSIWIITDPAGRLWLERRSRSPLRGLWMLPWRDGQERVHGSPAANVSHSIMSRRYRCAVYLASIPPEEIPGIAAGPGRWVAANDVRDLPHSSLLPKSLAAAGIPLAPDGAKQ